MKRRGELRAWTIGPAFVLLFLPPSFARPVEEHYKYCVRAADGQWTLQGYPPLIDLDAKMAFAQIVYRGALLDTVHLRNFDPAYELRFDYRFDAAGRMRSTRGLLRRWGHWVAEADLFPDANGKIPRLAVDYALKPGGSHIVEPDDGAEFESLFRTVPVYRTVQDIPCAGLLQEAEKMNATQK